MDEMRNKLTKEIIRQLALLDYQQLWKVKTLLVNINCSTLGNTETLAERQFKRVKSTTNELFPKGWANENSMTLDEQTNHDNEAREIRLRDINKGRDY